MAVEFELTKKGVLVEDPASVQSMHKGFFGSPYKGKGDRVLLRPEEALYFLDVRNASCNDKTFNDVAAKTKAHLTKYYCFKDWRDRGLVARPISEASGDYGRSPFVKYPSKKFEAPEVTAKGAFFKDDLLSVIDDEEEGRRLYEERWLGQYGTYKARKHGRYLKLDVYETLFLLNHCGYSTNSSKAAVTREAKKRRPDFKSLYDVYEDFRLRGFVVKTGFKFGTHFRLYFPGASPNREETEWMHSRHVIHVFPRHAKMIISEWARAIRVAHGVKKTFILAIPGRKRKGKGALDYLLYHRKHGVAHNPRDGKPRFAMLALNEEEEIGGEELSRSIENAAKHGLDLLLAICDRETSVTYYRVKRIDLPKSRFEYYEIEWFNP